MVHDLDGLNVHVPARWSAAHRHAVLLCNPKSGSGKGGASAWSNWGTSSAWKR